MNSGAIAIQERGHSHETSGLPCQDYCNGSKYERTPLEISSRRQVRLE